MNASSIALAIALLEALPRLIIASSEVLALIYSTAASLRQMQDQGREPTEAEWDAMHAVIKTLTDRINTDPAA